MEYEMKRKIEEASQICPTVLSYDDSCHETECPLWYDGVIIESCMCSMCDYIVEMGTERTKFAEKIKHGFELKNYDAFSEILDAETAVGLVETPIYAIEKCDDPRHKWIVPLTVSAFMDNGERVFEFFNDEADYLSTEWDFYAPIL